MKRFLIDEGNILRFLMYKFIVDIIQRYGIKVVRRVLVAVVEDIIVFVNPGNNCMMRVDL